ncbi:hypothetical protein J7L05_02610 [bacterium]|nr:hypothetical protein [bacterium]
MKQLNLFIALIFMFTISACSGHTDNPVTSPPDSIAPANEFVPQDSSDVLYSSASRETFAYKAFGIYHVRIDTVNLTAEIIPARNAQVIGDTFDADLTQFLILSPCYNCLKINGIAFLGDNQIQVGFSVKHPFPNINDRPDLHGFDVHGIVIANGNYNFPLTMVEQSDGETLKARANISLVANPDGYTSHFDSLAADTNYFDPPRDYNANINPYKRYFVDGTTGDFDPYSPSGYNVMHTGATWNNKNYIFNSDPTEPVLDFAFVVDCAYGHSATYKNRPNPYYFLPEYNRKEAWKVDYTIVSNDLQSGDTGSSAQIQVQVCDWQAGLTADPDYPNPDNMGGISADSDVASVSAEISNVSGLVEETLPASGSGTDADPYIFNLTVANDEGVAAGYYYGIIAVRDDLQGQQGPMGIPENPNGFPFEGPEITDYSTYQVFQIRVAGSPPEIMPLMYITEMDEGEVLTFDNTVNEPDGDDVTYQWDQISPVSPLGSFDDAAACDTNWQAPPLTDVPIEGVPFVLRFSATDVDGADVIYPNITVFESNSPPDCDGIVTDPYHGVFRTPDNINFSINAHDPDGDELSYAWDMNWDGDPLNFQENYTGSSIVDFFWEDNGFYDVGCKITENRTNPLKTYCSRTIIQEGIMGDIKVDNSPAANPGYYQQDVLMLRNDEGRPVYHVVWECVSDDSVYYCNNADDPMVFSNYQVISEGPDPGFTMYPKLAGNGNTVHVAWIESDQSIIPITYSVKINTSINGGLSFGSMGGERTIISYDSPDSMTYLDICAGSVAQQFYVVYQPKIGSNYSCNLLVSNNDGEAWDVPNPGTGQFRDVVDSTWISDCEIAVSANGVIHTFWRDTRTSPTAFYYDWSDDGGVTWNTDIQVSTTSNVRYGAMAVCDNADAVFTWTDNSNDFTYTRKAQYAGLPALGHAIPVYSTDATGNYYSVNIHVSPSGKTVILPITCRELSNYQQLFFVSNDYGYSYTYVYQKNFGSLQIGGAAGDCAFYEDPNRIELFTSRVDYTTGVAPSSHIYGSYLYVAERF